MRSINGGIWMGALTAVIILVFSGPARPLHRASAVSPLAVIPFQEMAQHIYAKGGIGSLGALSIVIDTGSPEFILSQNVYERLQLPLIGMVNIPSRVEGHMPTPAALTSVPSVSLGAVAIRNLRALVLPLDFIKANSGVETDAIIGSDLFSRYVVELDYSNKLLRLYEPSKYPGPRSGCQLPLDARGQPRVHAAILTKNGKSIDGVFLLDTGTEYSLFTKSFSALHPDVRVKYLSTKLQEGLGPGGVARGRIGQAVGIRLGGCTMRDPTVIFSENMTGMDPSGRFAGEIGLTIFREFTTIFNYPAGYVVFQRNTN